MLLFIDSFAASLMIVICAKEENKSSSLSRCNSTKLGPQMSAKIMTLEVSLYYVHTHVAFPFQGEALQFSKTLYYTLYIKPRLSCFTDKIVQIRQNRFSKWHFKKAKLTMFNRSGHWGHNAYA